MKIFAYERKEDGSLLMSNPIVVDSKNVPEGLYLADPKKTYNELGYEIDPPEPQPQEPSLEERIQALEAMELERILGGGF